jgi:hypothetical protein
MKITAPFSLTRSPSTTTSSSSVCSVTAILETLSPTASADLLFLAVSTGAAALASEAVALAAALRLGGMVVGARSAISRFGRAVTRVEMGPHAACLPVIANVNRILFFYAPDVDGCEQNMW